MNDSNAQQLVWLDKLRMDEPGVGQDQLPDMTVLATARETLPESVVEWALSIAAKVADEVDELRRTESIVTRAGAGKLERLACTAGVLTTLVSLRSGVPVPQAPDEMLRQIRVAFHQGVDLPSIIRFVWSHHARFQERLLLAQRKLASADDSGTQLQDLHARMHQILDLYISAIDTEFRQEQSKWAGGAPAQRREVIEEIIAGNHFPADVELRLGIRLSGSYFFAFVGSRDGALDEGQRERLRLLREKIGGQCGATEGFSQDFGDNDILWCLVFPTGTPTPAGNPLRAVRFPANLQVGVGPRAQGLEEVSRAILGAVEARRISHHPARTEMGRTTADLVFHDDIQLMSILTRSESELTGFTARTLGDLSRNTPKNIDLRRTLLTYLLHSRSRKEAAKVLRVSPNTVAYRVEQARELIGEDGPETSLQTLVALYVLDVLPGVIPPDHLES